MMKSIGYLLVTLLLYGCIDTTQHDLNQTTEGRVEENRSTEEINATPPVSEEEVSLHYAYLPMDQGEEAILYRSDGTAEGTERLYVATTMNHTPFGYPILKNFTLFGNYIYLDHTVTKEAFGDTIIEQLRIRIEDGEVEVSSEIEPSAHNAPRIHRLEANHQLYVQGVNPNALSQLWVYDTNGTYHRLERDFSLAEVPMVKAGEDIWLVAFDQQGYALLYLDTQQHSLMQVSLLDRSIKPIQLYVVDAWLYLVVEDVIQGGYQLWRYPLEEEGQARLIYTFSSEVGVDFLRDAGYVLDHQLFLIVPHKEGSELVVVREDRVQTLLETSATLQEMVAYGSTLWIGSSEGLWQSDGTQEGTHQQYDAQGNPMGGEALTLIEDRLYFVHEAWETGRELWVYDGNRSHLVVDIYSGEGSGNPLYVTALDGGVIFQATPDGEQQHLYYHKEGSLSLLE